MDNLNSTSILSTTTEIPLRNNASHNANSSNQNRNHLNTNEAAQDSGYSLSNGARTYAGSSAVGSRLAGDDAIGSRLASSVPYENNAELQRPMHSSSSSSLPPPANSSSMGMGSTPRDSINNRKLTDMSVQEVQKIASDRAEMVKSWSVKAYKCTKQMLSEKLGKSARTVDLELEAKIEILRETKQKYERLLLLTRALVNHFMSVVQTQKVLGSVFDELASKSQDLQEEFKFNGETQIVLAKNGENLIQAITFFVSSVNTLCTKTIEDTLLTVGKYESARLTYDAYRSELEAMNQLPRTEANILKQANAQASFNSNKLAYERLRSDVEVKLQFLEENRIKVMHKNLLLFHNAISAYFAGNQQQLEATMKQFNVRSSDVSSAKPTSWLERD